MATEIVLLSDAPVVHRDMHIALNDTYNEASSYHFHKKRHIMNVALENSTVFTVHESVEVLIPGTGTELLAEDVGEYRYWTDVVIPDHSIASTARIALEAMAKTVSGRLVERV